jgi:hypothetical protein
MPRKVFTAGEVLAAADVNSFLMDQTVMTFAGTAARGSAIGTATEGMVTWLNDQNALQVYDGTQWNGLAASGGNAIINGAFEINQRGFTSSTASGFTFDRINTAVAGDGTVTYSAQKFPVGSAPAEGFDNANFLRVVTSGQTSSAVRSSFVYAIEDVASFAGQTVTFSFYAKAGSSSPKIAVECFRSFGTGGSSEEFLTPQQVTISTTLTRYSVSFAIPNLAGKTLGPSNTSGLYFSLFFSAGSSLNSRTGSLGIQNNTFEIWGLQLEAGPTANVFRRNANSLQGELAACQRYFYQFLRGNDLAIGLGSALNAATAITNIYFPVTMRVAPALIASSGTNYYAFERNSALDYFNSFNISQPHPNAAVIFNNTEISSTSGVVGAMYTTNASASIAFNSEL